MSQRGKILDAERRWSESTYMPKIMPVKQSFRRELCIFFADGWRHVALGMGIGALMVFVMLLAFQPLGN